MSVEGQAALVVGGASGIGLATVNELLREGANVAVIDFSASGEAVLKELQAEFGPQRSLFVRADVTDDAQLEAAFATAKDHFKRLDIVVNSAGICNELNWNLEVDINLKGVMRGTLLAWKHMGKHEGGSGGTVINVSSIGGLTSFHILPFYSATKYGIIGFSRCCGEPYHTNLTGVRVITVCPGQTDTPILEGINYLTKDLEKEADKLKPLLTLQTPSNVAKGTLQVIKNGSSGSVWVIEDEKPAWEVVFPAYQDLRKTS